MAHVHPPWAPWPLHGARQPSQVGPMPLSWDPTGTPMGPANYRRTYLSLRLGTAALDVQGTLRAPPKEKFKQNFAICHVFAYFGYILGLMGPRGGPMGPTGPQFLIC